MPNVSDITTGHSATTQTNLSDAAGTLLDPTTLSNVSNQNTVLSGGDLTKINKSLKTSGLNIDLSPALNLVECAQNLEDRIIAKAQEKIVQYLLSNDKASEIIQGISTAKKYVETISDVVETIKSAKPKDLLTELAIAKGLQGLQRVVKINEILSTFGNTVNGVADLITNLDVLDICSAPNYYASGSSVGTQLTAPAVAPTPSRPTYPSASFDVNQIDIKNEYDTVMFDIKNHTGKDPQRTDEGGYVSMITSVNTVAIAYHDKIIKSISDADDSRFFSEFLRSVDIEKGNHSSAWSTEVKNEYQNRCSQVGRVIQVNASKIRAYGMRNSTGNYTGSMISTGVTHYSGPDADLTTFLDIKPEQRPAELTRYWESRGVNIASQEAKLAARGIKTGTLNYADAYKGPFGDRLISDFSCASTRVPIGSVLALKNPDGTPYNPSGKNTAGIYTVHDTGNIELTYKKVDIFTSTPKLYDATNMAAVQVFLVSRGTKEAPQYKRAQARYGGQ